MLAFHGHRHWCGTAGTVRAIDLEYLKRMVPLIKLTEYNRILSSEYSTTLTLQHLRSNQVFPYAMGEKAFTYVFYVVCYVAYCVCYVCTYFTGIAPRIGPRVSFVLNHLSK